MRELAIVKSAPFLILLCDAVCLVIWRLLNMQMREYAQARRVLPEHLALHTADIVQPNDDMRVALAILALVLALFSYVMFRSLNQQRAVWLFSCICTFGVFVMVMLLWP